MLMWREDLSVGHPDIDNDHQRLIAIINDFQNTVSKWPPERVIHEALIGLHDYAVQHFQREEAIQAACSFPFAKEHREEHADLLATVDAEARSLFVQKTKPITAEALQFVTDLLKRWLIEHIIKSDLKMRDYLKNLPK